MRFPGAIIFVNNDLTEQVKSVLKNQLFLSDVISGEEFDARVIADPNYVNVIRNSFQRVLVIRSFWDHTNRELANVVIFIKNGLAAIEQNNFGPPGQTYPVALLTIYELIPVTPH
jgi:hypothetical protein